MQHLHHDNSILDQISRRSSMRRLVRKTVHVKQFTQRLSARLRIRWSNNHSRSPPAYDHSYTYQKPKPKPRQKEKEQHGIFQLKSFDEDKDHQNLQHMMQDAARNLKRNDNQQQLRHKNSWNECFATCWAIACQFSRNLKLKDNQHQLRHKEKSWNKV